MGSERAERIRILLREGIDWEYLIRTAKFHGVMPLLYRSLNTTYPEAVPKAALDQLRDLFYAKNGAETQFNSSLIASWPFHTE